MLDFNFAELKMVLSLGWDFEFLLNCLEFLVNEVEGKCGIKMSNGWTLGESTGDERTSLGKKILELWYRFILSSDDSNIEEIEESASFGKEAGCPS